MTQFFEKKNFHMMKRVFLGVIDETGTLLGCTHVGAERRHMWAQFAAKLSDFLPESSPCPGRLREAAGISTARERKSLTPGKSSVLAESLALWKRLRQKNREEEKTENIFNF